MRLFVAIPMEGEIKTALRGIQNELRRRGVEGNYTRPENLHLTLAFIGEVPDSDAAAEAIAALRFRPVTLRLGGLGAFGELWWIGLEDGGELDALARRLRRALAESGVPFDRKTFRSHITLIRQPKYRNDPRLGTLAVPEAETRVDKISLMLSTRGKNGVIYTELSSVPARDEEGEEVD